MSSDLVDDDEIVFRRIPPGESYLEPPDRLTSANFKIRKMPDGTIEAGLSVYRAKFVTAQMVAKMPNAIPGSRVAWATAGDIRNLRGGDGRPLALDVVATPTADDPGHAEIRTTDGRRLSRSASVSLSRLFQLVDLHPPPSGPASETQPS